MSFTTIYVTSLAATEISSDTTAIRGSRSKTTLHLTRTITVPNVTNTPSSIASLLNVKTSSSIVELSSSAATSSISGVNSAASSSINMASTSMGRSSIVTTLSSSYSTQIASSSTGGLTDFIYPTPFTHRNTPRQDVAQGNAANARYSPLKIFMAVLGSIAAIMLIVVVLYAAFSLARGKYQRKMAARRKAAGELATAEDLSGRVVGKEGGKVDDDGFEEIDLGDEEEGDGVGVW